MEKCNLNIIINKSSKRPHLLDIKTQGLKHCSGTQTCQKDQHLDLLTHADTHCNALHCVTLTCIISCITLHYKLLYITLCNIMLFTHFNIINMLQLFILFYVIL